MILGTIRTQFEANHIVPSFLFKPERVLNFRLTSARACPKILPDTFQQWMRWRVYVFI